MIEKIKKTKSKNEEVVRVEEMKKVEVRVLRDDKQQIDRELVLKEEKVYISKDKEIRINIII